MLFVGFPPGGGLVAVLDVPYWLGCMSWWAEWKLSKEGN